MSFELDDEHKALQEAARELSQKAIAPIADEIYRSNEFPWKVYNLLNDAGYLSLYYPEYWGGAGMDLLSLVIVIEEIGRACPITAGLMSLQVIGSSALLSAGSSDLQNEWVPRLVAGKALGCFGLTEPGAGSDNLAMQTRAVKDGDTYVINGRKQFISNADVADFIQCFAKTDPAKGADGISVFLIPKDTPGYIVGRHDEKMGANAIHACEVIFEDCRVHQRQLIGPEGQGFRLAMKGINHGRPAVAAKALGTAQGALDHALRYAQERVQFGQPIAEFQGIQWMLADMATQIEAARYLVYRSAVAVQRGDPSAPRLGAMAKLFASDTAMKVTTDAVQIFGGYGYMKDYPVERRMAEAKLSQIIEGTNQIQRTVIARNLFKGR